MKIYLVALLSANAINCCLANSPCVGWGCVVNPTPTTPPPTPPKPPAGQNRRPTLKRPSSPADVDNRFIDFSKFDFASLTLPPSPEGLTKPPTSFGPDLYTLPPSPWVWPDLDINIPSSPRWLDMHDLNTLPPSPRWPDKYDLNTLPPSPRQFTRPPTWRKLDIPDFATLPPSFDFDDFTLPPSPPFYDFNPFPYPHMDLPQSAPQVNVATFENPRIANPQVSESLNLAPAQYLDMPQIYVNSPEVHECLSDEDCLLKSEDAYTVFGISMPSCPMFCVDGKCKPRDEKIPPVLRLKTGRKASFGNFKLREDEELEKVFDNPPTFYKPDAIEGRFFELTDKSDEIIEVKYADNFFDVAARVLENPFMKGFVEGDKEDRQAPAETDGTEISATHKDNTRRGLAIQDDAPDRWRVSQTSSNPWRRNGRLSMGCTAALIGNRVLITAAHCVWDRDTDSWADFPIYFAAGQDGDNKPFGDARVWKMTIPAGYQTCNTNNKCRAHDWAVLVLYESQKLNVGYFGFSTSIGNSRLNLAGYPQSKNRQLWYDHCALHSDEGDWIKHRCDTEPGNSGSGIYKIVNGGRYVVAVHGGGYTDLWNRGADVDGDTSSAGRLYDRMLAYRVEYG